MVGLAIKAAKSRVKAQTARIRIAVRGADKTHARFFLAREFEEVIDEQQVIEVFGQRVAAIPTKRAAPAETRYLERDEITTLFAELPTRGRRALRDRILLLTLFLTYKDLIAVVTKFRS